MLKESYQAMSMDDIFAALAEKLEIQATAKYASQEAFDAILYKACEAFCSDANVKVFVAMLDKLAALKNGKTFHKLAMDNLVAYTGIDMAIVYNANAKSHKLAFTAATRDAWNKIDNQIEALCNDMREGKKPLFHDWLEEKRKAAREAGKKTGYQRCQEALDALIKRIAKEYPAMPEEQLNAIRKTVIDNIQP